MLKFFLLFEVVNQCFVFFACCEICKLYYGAIVSKQLI